MTRRRAHRRDATGRVVDLDRRRAPASVMRVERRRVLVAKHGTGVIVDAVRERLWRRMTLAPRIDRAIRPTGKLADVGYVGYVLLPQE